MIFRAIKFAAEAHEGHYRKGAKIPYITHPVNVMKTLLEAGCDVEVAIAGLLHDVVEDTPYTVEMIESKFGERVADLVCAASEPEDLRNEGTAVDNWQERKEHTIDSLSTQNDIDKLLVTCADKLDNIRAIKDDYERLGDKLWERFNAGKKSQQWYYESLSAVIQDRGEELGEPLLSLAKKLDNAVQGVFNVES